jgi:hypothetical protein
MSLETKDLVSAARRRPLFFVCGALALACALLAYFRMDVRGDVETRLEERERELARLSNNVRLSAQLDAQLEALRQANETIAAGALRVAELARNQQVFYQLEAASGVKLLDLRQLAAPAPARPAPGPGPASAPAAAPAPTTYAPINFSLTVRGDYPQLIEFLHRLDRGATLSRVTSAIAARSGEDDYSLTLTVQLLGFRP